MDKKKIVFIDDDADYLESKKLYLEKKYDVRTALSAGEGMEKIKKEKPDLIILDAMMEPKSGFTLAKELKKDPSYSDIPLIMLTGVAPQITDSKYSADDVLRFEGDEFIDKTEGTEEILAAIERLIDRGGKR